MVVGGERVALLVVQAVAIGGDAGHEDVAADAVAAGADGGLHLGGRGAALPIVGIVENHLEAAAGQGFPQRIGVVPIRHEVLHAAAEVVLRLAVQNRHIVAALHQLLHQQPADEESSTDDQYLHMLLGTSRKTRRRASNFLPARPALC